MSEATDKKLGVMLDRIRAGEAAKDPYRPMWLLNHSYYDGHQDIDFDEQEGAFVHLRAKPIDDDEPEDWRSFVTCNIYRLIASTTVAKLTQNRPISEADPVHPDWASRSKARVAKKIFDYTWDSMILARKLRTVVHFALLSGCGWWALYWDPNAGEDMGNGVKSGAPVVDPCSNFEIGFDPMCASYDKAGYCYRIHHMTTEAVKRITGKKVNAEDGSETEEYMSADRAHSPELTDGQNRERLHADYVTVWEYYDLVNKKMYWLSRDAILQSFDWTMGVPFIPFYFEESTGRVMGSKMVYGNIYGATPMADVRQPQKELNAILSHTKDIRRLTASPRYFLPKQVKINENTLSAAPGAFIEISNGGVAPIKIDSPEVPAYVMSLIQQFTEYAFRIIGINEISEGRSSGSLQSGRAAGMMLEADAGRFAPVAANISRAINLAFYTLLRYWHEFSTDETLAALVGPNAGMELATWTRSDVNMFNIRVREGSTFARSKALRRQDILEAVQTGIIESPKQARKMLEFDETEEIEGDAEDQRFAQRRELEQMIVLMQPVTPNPWDDHEIHADETKAVLLSPDYKTFPPQVQKWLAEHWQYHTQEQAKQMAAIQGRMQGVAPGGQEGPGGQVSMHKGIPSTEGSPV